MYKKYSEEWFLDLYLRYESVEEVIRSSEERVPISAADYHRKIKKNGLVCSAGRQVSLPETLHFFREHAMIPGAPLAEVYRQMPPSFQTSLGTLHRIYQIMEKKFVRRYAAALIITQNEDEKNVLVGNELFGNSRYGKRKGDISIPMGFAKKDESNYLSVLRVLQREVFTLNAVKGEFSSSSNFAKELLSKEITPFMCFDILDVRVKVFKLNFLHSYSFSSYRLANHRTKHLSELFGIKSGIRSGVLDMLRIYNNYLYSKPWISEYYTSSLNKALFAKT